MILEKNDVNVKPLFSWGKEFGILNDKDETIAVIYMRLVGDSDLNRARIYALRKSAEKRKKLRDPQSDDHLAFIQDIDELETERLVSLCTLLASRTLAKEALKEVNIPEPKEPKADATTEQMEVYQQQIDDYPAKQNEAFKEYITKKIEYLTQVYEKKPKEELYTLYVNYFVDELCESEMLTAFKEMCTYYGTFKDEGYKNRFFASFEEFINLDGMLKQQLIGAYETLDVSPDELKKLRVATL